MLTVTGGPLLPLWQKRGREEQVRGPHPRCSLPVLFGDLSQLPLDSEDFLIYHQPCVLKTTRTGSEEGDAGADSD